MQRDNSAKLKIGFVFDDSLDKTDGVQQYILALGNWFLSNGHQVHYLVGQTSRTDIPNIHSLSRNVKVKFNGNRLSIPLPVSKTKIKDILQKEQYDVLHVQLPYSPLLAGKIISLASSGTAVIGTFHILPYGALSRFGTRLLGVITKKTLLRFDQILSVSEAASGFAMKSFKIKTQVLPNVVDHEKFSRAEAIPKYDDDVLNIMFLGRLVPRKGCNVLLEAIHLVRSDTSLPQFRVLICGKGDLLKKLKQYTSKMDLSDIVEFIGFVSEEDKPRYYASADIAVFPSSGGESFGIVLLEAMSGGAAVLAGDNPGYRSVLSNLPNQLFDPYDSVLLSNKIMELLNDSELRKTISNNGNLFAKQFDVPIVARTLLELYNEALHKRRAL